MQVQVLRAPYVPWMLAAVIAVELALVSGANARTPHPMWPLALGLDVLLLGGAAVWWKSRRVGQRERWQEGVPEVVRAFGIALLATVAVMNLLSLPGASQAWKWLLLLEPLLALFVAITVIRVARSARAKPDAAQVVDELAKVVPRRVAELVVAELRIMTAALDVLRRAPLPSLPAGAVTHSAKSTTQGRMLGVLVVSLVELPAAHALLHYVAGAPSWVHLTVFALHAWGALWLLGDDRLMRTTTHVLGNEALRIELGLRWRGRVRYEDIRKVEPLPPNQGPMEGTVDVTPLPRPNVCVQLERPVELVGLFGLRRTTQDLHLYVDDPETLISQLTQRVQR